MNTLFIEHINTLQARYSTILDEQDHDALIISAGRPKQRFLDDTCYPFRANPHFLAWAPLTAHPNCWLLIRPGYKPQLYYYLPTDFWHLTPALPDAAWVDCFELVPFSQQIQLQRALGGLQRAAYIGEEEEEVRSWGVTAINPEPLLHALHYARAIKTPYEQACIRQANRIAVKGHQAAVALFHEGASEYAIQLAYLQATEHTEAELPYDNIIALNEHAATLHYQFHERQPPAHARTLLIDAGAQYQGYAADITRTYSAEQGLFHDLIEALDATQQNLAGQLKAGLDFVALHERAHHAIAELLQRFGIVNAPVEQQLELDVTHAFFPHGLGHFLGLQVHDVGGWQHSPDGTLHEPPRQHPYLRLTRPLEAGHVITLEPGLYLIPALLAELKSNAATRALIDWALIDQLLPYGGIRIEDNLCITETGCENYTREAFAP